jgi:hypothetical protein
LRAWSADGCDGPCPVHFTTPTSARTAGSCCWVYCLAAFVAISFLAREQPDNTYVLVKADRLVRTAGTPFAAK